MNMSSVRQKGSTGIAACVMFVDKLILIWIQSRAVSFPPPEESSLSHTIFAPNPLPWQLGPTGRCVSTATSLPHAARVVTRGRHKVWLRDHRTTARLMTRVEPHYGRTRQVTIVAACSEQQAGRSSATSRSFGVEGRGDEQETHIWHQQHFWNRYVKVEVREYLQTYQRHYQQPNC